MKFHKAQIWTLDFLILALVLSFVILIFIFTWNSLSRSWNTAEEYSKLWHSASFAAESLLSTSGEPKRWEHLLPFDVNNIAAIGLADGRNIINPLKLSRMGAIASSNYTLWKSKLALGQYEAYLNLSSLNRNITYFESGKKANSTNNIPNVTAAIERLVIYNNTINVLRLEVWR